MTQPNLTEQQDQRIGVDGIADRLTEAERNFLLFLPHDQSWRESYRQIQLYGRNALRGFGKSGLVEGYYRETVKHRLTPLGALVVDSLPSNKDQ
jgi:hypothetical protein